MIRSISSVNFGDTAPAQNFNELINAPGKYASSPAQEAAVPKGDEVDFSTKPEKKSHTGAIIGGVIGALALVWIGLGIAVGKGKLAKIEGEDLKFAEKFKNAFFEIGNSAKKAYDSTLGKWFGKAEEAAADAAETKVKSSTEGGEASTTENTAS